MTISGPPQPFLPESPTPPRQERDPLHLIIAAGAVLILVVGLVVAGFVAVKVFGRDEQSSSGKSGASQSGTTLPSCEELGGQARDAVARISAAPDGTDEYDSAIEDLVSIGTKASAQDCPPLK